MTDALERIKNRQRPEVPRRDPGMTPTPTIVVDTSTSSNSDIEVPKYPDIQISTLPDLEKSTISPAEAIEAIASANSTSNELKISRLPDIQISRNLDIANNRISTGTEGSPLTIDVKQTTLRLEKALNDELHALCYREQICREVLIEAMFLEVVNTPELLNRILVQAQERQRKRTTVANHKRALSMVQRLSN
ncbi:hypothetical protein [Chamaesiphon sp.]|uniref:hypothetical protein n=1 Tax=Chamaesiphon sp. TaxID=2814140 RepID=UPI0035933C1F